MSFPISRPRRLRVTQAFRDMVAETNLNIDDLMYPIFVVHGNGIKKKSQVCQINIIGQLICLMSLLSRL